MATNRYLPSHLGEIPDNWMRVKLSDVMKVRQGLQIAISDRLTSPTPTSREYITIQSIKKQDQAREYVETPSQRVICCKDDVLMTRTGNTGIVVTDVDGVFHNNFFLMDFDRTILDKDFLVDYLRTERVQHLILTKAGASTIPDLNHKDFYSIELPLAPLPEQQKIAKILSTWDKAIATTERLIATSQQQKKALMQQLLTGKKRLVNPDTGMVFEGDWEEVKLDDIAIYRRGSFPQPYGNPEWVDDINGYPFIQVFDIDKNMKLKNTTKTKISDAAIGKSVFIKSGTVIVSLQGSIGRVAITQYDAYVDRTVLLFQKYKRDMDLVYFAYSIQELFEIEKEKAPGGTIKTITKEVLSDFTILVPAYIEQQKIASVLNVADKEIELLETKLARLKDEKKALMQQLLTGKRRVKLEAMEAA